MQYTTAPGDKCSFFVRFGRHTAPMSHASSPSAARGRGRGARSNASGRIPLWLMRILVKKFPWLLAERGEITRSKDIGPGEVTIKMSFGPEDQQKFIEMEAKLARKNLK